MANLKRQISDLFMMVPSVTENISSLRNITILAPTNAAFDKLVESSPSEAGTEDTDLELLTHLLQYHVINGTFSSSVFSTTPAFVRTLLVEDGFANVTGGGQNVGLVLDDNNVPTVVSGLMQESTITVAVSCDKNSPNS